MKRLLLAFVLVLIARPVWATCSGMCVQESSVVQATSGAAPNPTVGSNTTVGDAVLAVSTTSNGTIQPTVSGMGATWVLGYDTGSSTSSGNRTVVWCGVVVTPATSLTFSGQNTTSAYIEETNKKGCNIATANGLTNVGHATTGTSVTSFSIATLTSAAFIFASVTHRASESVTDSNGLTKTNLNATSPTFNGDYGGNSGTNSFAYSWTTSSANAWGAWAFDDQCTNNDACVEMAPGAHAAGGTNATVTFPSSPSLGQIVVVKVTDTLGNSSVSPVAASGTDIYVDQWRLIGDTGNSTSGGVRTFTYCGVVTTTGTTAVFSANTGSTGIIGAVFKGYTCAVDQSAAYNSSSSTVSSTTVPSITTTIANDLVIGGATHAHLESQTDTSTGFRPLVPFAASNPIISMNYQVASGTGTFSVGWSWTTASVAAGSIIALIPGNTHTTVETQLMQLVVPVSVSTPVPPVLPNQGAFYKGSQGNSQRCGTSLGTGVLGCSLFFKWAQLEPQNGVFDWSAIDYALSFDTGSSTPPNYPVQIQVLTGDGGAPTTDVVCNSFGPPPTESSPPTCQPWLSGVAGVATHWRAGAVSGTPHGGLFSCQPTFDPAPWDTTYQSALQAFEVAFNTKYASSNVKLISLNPAAPDGHNMGLDISIANQTCADWDATHFYTTNTILQPCSATPSTCTTINPGQYNYNETVADCVQGGTPPTWNQTPSTVTNDGTCRWTNLGIAGAYTEYYNSAWAALAAAQGKTTEADWDTFVSGAVDTMISQQTTAISSITTSLWVQASNWPSIVGGNGSHDSDTSPTGIQQTYLNYAQAHQNGVGYYVINEALQNTGFTSGLLSHWITAPNTAKAGAQMVKQLSTSSGDCAKLCGALLPCGGCAGVGFAQIYVPDTANCPTTMADYNEVVQGDALHLCAAVGTCTNSSPTCPY